MFFEGKGHGGKGFLFGTITSLGMLWASHALLTGGIMGFDGIAGTDIYKKVIAGPSEAIGKGLSHVFKVAVNAIGPMFNYTPPASFASAGTALVPDGAVSSLTDSIKSIFGGKESIIAAPALDM